MGASASVDGDEERYHPDDPQQYESSAEGVAGTSDQQQQQGGVLQPEAILQHGASRQYTPEEYALYCEQYYAWYGVDPPDAPPPQSESTAADASNDRKQGSKESEAADSEAALELIACYGSDSD